MNMNASQNTQSQQQSQTGSQEGAQQGTQQSTQQNTQQNAQNSSNTYFTQEDMNRVATREKEQGRASILKALGVESLEAAQAAINAYNEQQEKSKTDVQKANDAAAKAQGDLTKAQAENARLSNTLSALKKGAKPDSVDDLVTLVQSKVTGDKDFAAALDEVKQAYPVFFNDGGNTSQQQQNKGTGGTANHARSSSNQPDFGERLAKNRMGSHTAQDNPFFK